MRKNTSYLDSLNDGRQRRSRTSLEDLDRTLRGLEERIGAGRGPGPNRAEAASSRDFADRFRNLGIARQVEPRTNDDRSASARLPSSSSFKTLAQDIELARIQEKNVAAVESIAAELKSLRSEIHGKMSSGMQHEFDALRAEIAKTYRNARAGTSDNDLSDDIARLSDNIRALAQRSDDSGVNMLRLEFEEVKKALASLAREESVRQISERCDDMDRRWDTLNATTRSLAGEPEFQTLAARLDEIGEAVNRLPGSLPLGSLEEKLRVLASAVEQLSRNHEPISAQSLDLIEQRLDEISRAIVASSVSVQAAVPSSEPFERIEARISSLARQIEELVENQAPAHLLERIDSLAERVENLSSPAGAPQDAVDNLAAQIAELSEKMDRDASGSGPESVLRALELRYNHLADMFERQRDATEEQGQALLRDLEARLGSVSAAPSESFAEEQHDELIQAIESRFDELARHFESRMQQGPDDRLLQSLEQRLEEISSRLDGTGSRGTALDNDLVRSLENQIASLSEHLQRPESVIPEDEDIGPRLREIEQSLAVNREQILDAAREAAEAAIRSLPAAGSDTPMVTALAEDLKSLDQLARNSDERNSRTFEAIHDTLLKIVDRLASLEDVARGGERAARQPVATDRARRFDEFETPSIEPGVDHRIVDEPRHRTRSAKPDEVAGETALADIDEATDDQRPRETARKSMLGGFARAFKGRGGRDDGDAPIAGHDAADIDMGLEEETPEFESEDANTPLEPGSGAPDVGTIMARVKEDRGGANGTDADAAKSDFIAAARRAAQAAAAEAETSRSRMEKGKTGGRFNALDMLRRRRKPIIVGASALLIALAALQLGKAFLNADAPRAVADAPISEEREQVSEMTPMDEELSEDVTEASVEIPPARMAEPVAAAADTAEPVEAGLPELSAKIVEEPPVIEKEEMAPAPVAAVEPIPVEAGPVALREAAESGDAKALFEIGSRYAEGRGVGSDLKKAAKWFQASADLGYPPAQYRIGNFFEKGLGIERDPAKAMTWYQLAAEQGNASAMHNLAVLFAMGANGQADNQSAARWFLKAAELGVKDSQFNLGILTAKGVGAEQDLEESYKWFALAAKNGDKDAASKRDEIANALRPEQLATARAAVDLWKAKPLVAEANNVDIPPAWTEDAGQTAAVDMKQAVKNIQLILNNNGYDAGPADGLMGQRTKDAITAFQKDNDMPATGEVDEALVKALLALNE